MEFLNNTSLEAITDQDVSIFLKTAGSQIDCIELCRTFVKDGKLWVDFIPRFSGKYVAEVPDDAVISRNEEELSVGRYGIFIRQDTPAGRLARALLDAKQQGQKG